MFLSANSCLTLAVFSVHIFPSRLYLYLFYHLNDSSVTGMTKEICVIAHTKLLPRFAVLKSRIYIFLWPWWKANTFNAGKANIKFSSKRKRSAQNDNVLLFPLLIPNHLMFLAVLVFLFICFILITVVQFGLT